MILNLAGIPAGYGYFEEVAPVNENIIPTIQKAIIANDKDFGPISIQTVSLQVSADAKVSINGRLPVLVQPNIGLSFDVRGTVYSIVFDTAVQYNIAFTY